MSDSSDDSGDDFGDYERVQKTAEFRFDFDGMSNEEDDFTSDSDNEYTDAVNEVIAKTMDNDEALEKEALAKQARKKRRDIRKEQRKKNKNKKLYTSFYYFKRLRLHFADKVFVRANRRNGDPLQIAVTELDKKVYNQTDKNTYVTDFAYSTSGSNFNPDQELQKHIQNSRNKILADVENFKYYKLKDSFDDALTSEKVKKRYTELFKKFKLTNPVYNGIELDYVPVSSMKKRKGYSVRNNGEKVGNKKRKNGQFNLSLKF